FVIFLSNRFKVVKVAKMKFFSRIYLLLWKNAKIKLRHPLSLLLEIGLPCLFSATLVLLRMVISFDHVTSPTIFPALPVDVYELLHSKTVLYAPKSKQTDSVMDIFLSRSKANSLHGKDSRYFVIIE